MLKEYHPSKQYSGWIGFNAEVFLSNLQKFSGGRYILDLSIPILAQTAVKFDEDLIRCGFKFLACDRARVLANLCRRFSGIMLPGFSPDELGYASDGLLPVLSAFSEILCLSNMAQSYDVRYGFILRIRTNDEAFSYCNTGFRNLLGRISTLPMIDLRGLFIDFEADEKEINKIVREISAAFDLESILVFGKDNCITPLKLLGWEVLGLENSMLPLPFELGFWAYPIKTELNKILYRTDFGLKEGLPDSFPVKINNRIAEVTKVDFDHCILSVEAIETPSPAKGYFLGGDNYEPVSQHHWRGKNLKNLLWHYRNLPVYVISEETTEEILPFRGDL
ncbi:MAG: hypothetical protein Kow0029_11220 [Candidatus Rifleibacteriota bacterium]